MSGPRDPLTGPAQEDAFAPTMAGSVSATSTPGRVETGDMPLEDAGFGERYQLRSLLGQGGMGDVLVCRDQRIGREVAVKVARTTSGASRDEQVARFAREARVQGQLEHPAIVPVYDLGRRPDGAVYFTMKRVRGLTLQRIVEGLRGGDEAIVQAYSRRKLLAAFVSVCQAVHFANTRGVLHRDLKPGNLMLGDFGEVYVLDWGLAELLGEAEPEEPEDVAPPLAEATPAPSLTPRASRPPRLDAASTPGPATTTGSVMGTPGYMAPEQLRGEIERLDARADVYALGALLFELLTYEPLHPRGASAETMRSTLEGADARARTRAPSREVPPELEAVCVRATALAPEDRYASVRELVEAVERFLDGDRDLARRHELAEDAARLAEAAADRALAPGATDAEGERRTALAHAGHALALEPTNAAAMRTMVRLLLAPPAVLPAEVERDLEHGEREMVRVASVKGGWTFLTYFLFVPFVFWMGVRGVAPLAVWLVLVGASAALGFLGARARYSNTPLHLGGLVVSYASIVLLGALFGPFVLVPVMASVNTVVLLLHSRPRWRVPTIVLGMLSVLVPIAADHFGLWPVTTSFVDDALVVRSWMAHLPPTPTLIALTAVMGGTVLIPAIYVLRVRDSLTTAERNLHLQSWHLRQLIPAEARDALGPPRAEYASPLFPCPLEPER